MEEVSKRGRKGEVGAERRLTLGLRDPTHCHVGIAYCFDLEETVLSDQGIKPGVHVIQHGHDLLRGQGLADGGEACQDKGRERKRECVSKEGEERKKGEKTHQQCRRRKW